MIVRKAEGNPFFLEEVIRTLIDMGAIERDASSGRWHATAEIETVSVPDNIQGVIMARVDRLDEQVKQVLRTAAVIGHSFLYRVLRAVAEAERQLDEHVAELQAVELVREKRRVPELEYIFKHALAQEATYESILLRSRRTLHRRVGEAIESLFSDRLDEFYGLLAYHYARAVAWEKAQEYLLKAGDQAGGVAADAEALAHYKDAMTAYERAFGESWDPAERAALERKMGEALFRRGDQTEALQYLRRALVHYDRPFPLSRWGTRRAILRELAAQIGHRILPGLFVKQASGQTAPGVQDQMRIYYVMAWIEVFSDLERFLMVILRFLNSSERAGHAQGVAISSSGLGTAAGFVSLFGLAGGLHRRALRAAERLHDPGVLGLAYQNLAVHEHLMGQEETSLQYCHRAAEAHQEAGDLHAKCLAMLFQAYNLDCRGEFSAALLHAQEIIELGQETADLQVLCWGEYVLGRIQRRLGQLNGGSAHLQKAVDLADAIPDQLARVEAAGNLARCYLAQGQSGEALAILQSRQEVAIEHGVRSSPLTPLRNGLAEAYLLAAERSDGSERQDLLKKAKRSCKAALKQGKAFRPGMPDAMRLQGTYEWLRGRSAAALKWWERSIALANEMGHVYDVGVTSLEIGQRLHRRAQLEKAEAVFAEIGVEAHLVRTKEALRALAP